MTKLFIEQPRLHWDCYKSHSKTYKKKVILHSNLLKKSHRKNYTQKSNKKEVNFLLKGNLFLSIPGIQAVVLSNTLELSFKSSYWFFNVHAHLAAVHPPDSTLHNFPDSYVYATVKSVPYQRCPVKSSRIAEHQRYSELRTSDHFDETLAYPGFGLGENMIFPKYELKLYFLVEHNF